MAGGVVAEAISLFALSAGLGTSVLVGQPPGGCRSDPPPSPGPALPEREL